MIYFGSIWNNFLLSSQLWPTVTQMSHTNMAELVVSHPKWSTWKHMVVCAEIGLCH